MDKVVAQAQQAEADGFSSLWYASVVMADPLVAMAVTGRETSSIDSARPRSGPIRAIERVRQTRLDVLTRRWSVYPLEFDELTPTSSLFLIGRS